MNIIYTDKKCKKIIAVLFFTMFLLFSNNCVFAQILNDQEDLQIDPNTLKNASPSDLMNFLKDFNQHQVLKAQPTETASEYLGSSKFWFESFQNWQSEFLSVFAIVILSIFLRQKGSPQSKPVDAPDSETGG